MSDLDKTPNLHPANEVIAKLYSTVVDNKHMLDFFNAWDTYAEYVFREKPEEAEIWQPLLIEHFEQASALVVVKQPSMAEEKQAFLDRQKFPAVLFNSHFRIVAQNRQATSIWPIKLDTDISSAILPPFDPASILSLRASQSNHTDPILLSLEIGSIDQPNVVMAVVHPVELSIADGKSTELLFILRVAQPRWFPELARLLAQTYGLTESEVEIARGLHQNKTLNTIAQERVRSVKTVRTQLSNVFEKTGASSQTELVSMISNLGQILETDSKKSSIGISPTHSGSSNQLTVSNCTSNEGHQLSYVTYGDRSGQTVLSLQPTIPPESTVRFRQAACNAGLFFVVPYKPGSGQSSSRSYRYQPALASQDYKAILDAEGIKKVNVLGIYSGGIYALDFANTYPETIQKIVLADTGIPLNLPSDFLKMSSIVRRTFLPARISPSILLTPHKMVAKEFHESKAGQRRIVEYFFKGSPSDQKLITENKEYFNVTRDMIQYSFEDIKQLVDNVCLWAGNWKSTLEPAANAHQLCFVHGEYNDVFMWEAVKAYVEQKPNVEAVKLSGCSQLGIFVKPEKLMQLF